MNRYDHILEDLPGEDNNVGQDSSAHKGGPITYLSGADSIVRSKGPSSRLFHIRGPGGYTMSIPLRHLDASIEWEPNRALLKIAISHDDARAIEEDVRQAGSNNVGYPGPL